MRAKKRLGQHFLRDHAVMQEIVACIRPQPEDHFLELGAGDGALTGNLLRSGASVRAIELDRGLIGRLRRKLPADRLEIVQGDLLSVSWDMPAASVCRRLVGNLPYNISSLCLARAMHRAAHWRDCYFLVQLEVAQRLTAEPAMPHWGRLAVLAHCTVDSRLVMTVEPEAFSPPPKVRSALVRLQALSVPPVAEAGRPAVLYTARQLFSMRRKTLRTALKAMQARGDLTAAARAGLEIDDSVRAEAVDMATLQQIAACVRLPDSVRLSDSVRLPD